MKLYFVFGIATFASFTCNAMFTETALEIQNSTHSPAIVAPKTLSTFTSQYQYAASGAAKVSGFVERLHNPQYADTKIIIQPQTVATIKFLVRKSVCTKETYALLYYGTKIYDDQHGPLEFLVDIENKLAFIMPTDDGVKLSQW